MMNLDSASSLCRAAARTITPALRLDDSIAKDQQRLVSKVYVLAQTQRGIWEKR